MKKILIYVAVLIGAILFPVSSAWPLVNEAMNYFSMGYYYLYEGNLRQAKNQFKHCLYLERDPPSILYSILAEISNMLGEREEAKQYAEKALQIDPQNESALKTLSFILVQEKKYNQAVKYLNQLHNLSPDNLQVLFYLSEIYNQLQNEEALLEIYLKIIRLDPEQVDIRINLGYLYTKKGAFNLAKEQFKKALELDRDNEKAIFYLTYIYLSEGNTEATLELFKKLDSKNLLNNEMLEDYVSNIFIEGQDPRPILKKIEDREKMSAVTKGIEEYVNGNIDRAQQLFQQALAENPDSIAACVGLVRISVQKENHEMEEKWRFMLAGTYYNYTSYEKALNEALRVKELDPEFLDNRYLLGDIYSVLGRDEQAIAEYEYFEQNAQKKGDIYVKLGFEYDKIGNHQKAIQMFLNAIEQSPENDQLYHYLGIEYRILEDYKKAVEYFEKALKLKGENADYYFNLGVCYERMGEIETSIYYLDNAVRLDNSNPVALNYLGYLLADEGIRLEEAKQYIEKALNMDPLNGAYLDSMGWVYYRLEEYEKARQYLEEAVKYMDPAEEENYLIYEHLGDVYYRMERFNEAIQAWRKALELKDVKEVRFKIKRAEGRLNK